MQRARFALCALALAAPCWFLFEPALAWCSPGQPAAVATIFPIGALMRALAGPAVSVSILLPAGASPHHYEMTPAQARLVADADLLVSVGNLDRWAQRFFEAGQARKITLLEACGVPADANPHIWLDPVLVRTHLVPILAQALEEVAPAEVSAMAGRRQKLVAELADLDAEIKQSLARVGQRRFIAFHSAWLPFAARYDLEQVAVVEGGEGSEPSAAKLASVIERARQSGTTALLVDAQIRSRAAAALASELGGEPVIVDPLGGPNLPGRNSYLTLMRFNLEQFMKALR